MEESLGDLMASATAIVSLVAALCYWLVYATRAEKGLLGAGVKALSTAGLALALLLLPLGGWFWLIPLGLALGALGDLFLALGGVQRFLAGVAAFGLGHLAYAGGLLLRSGDLGFDGFSGGEVAALVGLFGLLASTEVWLAPRTGELRQPVRAYVALIGVMGAAAVLIPAYPGQGVLRLGAALFVLSDLMLALQLFVVKDAVTRTRLALALWPAYWAGQALIAVGAMMLWQVKG